MQNLLKAGFVALVAIGVGVVGSASAQAATYIAGGDSARVAIHTGGPDWHNHWHHHRHMVCVTSWHHHHPVKVCHPSWG